MCTSHLCVRLCPGNWCSRHSGSTRTSPSPGLYRRCTHCDTELIITSEQHESQVQVMPINQMCQHCISVLQILNKYAVWDNTCEVLSRWICSLLTGFLCRRVVRSPSLPQISHYSRPWLNSQHITSSPLHVTYIKLKKKKKKDCRQCTLFTGVMACPRRCWQSGAVRQSCPEGGSAQCHGDRSGHRSGEEHDLRCPGRLLREASRKVHAELQKNIVKG